MNRAAARWLKKVLADSRLDDDTRTVARPIAEHLDARGHLDATEEDLTRWANEIAARQS